MSGGITGTLSDLANAQLTIGSLLLVTYLATYAMARGWVDFWLIWIGVDLVGVPLLLRVHLYPSALLYVVYGCFVIWGFAVWLKVSRMESGPAPVLVTKAEVAR